MADSSSSDSLGPPPNFPITGVRSGAAGPTSFDSESNTSDAQVSPMDGVGTVSPQQQQQQSSPSPGSSTNKKHKHHSHSHSHSHEEHEGPESETLHYLDSEFSSDPRLRGSLFSWARRPRQFVLGKVRYVERGERKVTWDELFLDLLYVAVIGKLGAVLKSMGVSGQSVNDVMLLFAPVWLSWYMFISGTNRFANDDLLNRLFLYVSMILVAGMGLNAEYAFSTDPEHNTANIFIATYLLLRSLHLIADMFHAWVMPEFRRFLFVSFMVQLMNAIPWMVSLSVSVDEEGMKVRRALWWTSIALDFSFIAIGLVSMKRTSHFFTAQTALNNDHYIERMGLFTLVVLGEVIVALLWSSNNPAFSAQYADTIFGLIIAICLQWTYFVLLDGHGGVFVHPLRRGMRPGVSWAFLHFPAHGSIMLAGVAVAMLIKYNPQSAVVEPGKSLWYLYDKKAEGMRWLLCGSLAVTHVCYILLALTHKSLDVGNIEWLDGKPPKRAPRRTPPISPISPMAGKAERMEQGKVAASADIGAVKETIHSTDAAYRAHLEETHKNLPEWLRKHIMEVQVEKRHWKILDPRFTKWMRLAIRLVLVLALLGLGIWGQSIKSTSLLGTVTAMLVVQTLVEEVGRVRNREYVE